MIFANQDYLYASKKGSREASTGHTRSKPDLQMLPSTWNIGSKPFESMKHLFALSESTT